MPTNFRDDLSFLSNFHPVAITVPFSNGEHMTFPTVENAFQATKCAKVEDRAQFTTCTPAEAKRLGRTVALRGDWEQVKLTVMMWLVSHKFRVPELAARLVATPESLLTEENDWGDTFWGVCNGVGEDHLGRILKKVRKELIDEAFQAGGTKPPTSGHRESRPSSRTDKVHEEAKILEALKGRRVLAFTGHRPKDLKGYDSKKLDMYLQSRLAKLIRKTEPVTGIVGGAAGVDQDAHHALNALKAEGYDVQIVVAIPFEGHGRNWPTWAKAKAESLLDTADHIVVLAPDPGDDTRLVRQLLLERNTFMVDHAQEVIAVWNGKETGGTYACQKYAREVGVPVRNLHSGWLDCLDRMEVTTPATTQYTAADIKYTLPQRKRTVVLTAAVKGDEITIQFHSEDLCRWQTFRTEGTYLQQLMTALTGALSVLKADTPVTVDIPVLRKTLSLLPAHAKAGFVETHGANVGRDIPMRKQWETLHEAVRTRAVTFA